MRNTYWKLVAQERQARARREGQRELEHPRRRRVPVSGSGGCNNIVGGFTLEGERPRFTGMGSTMMMCPEGMDQEREFLKMLDAVALSHRGKR
ncbi:MAG: META domain-containing protein [Burkholderiales bacterium]